VIKTSGTKLADHVESMRETVNAVNIFVGKLEGRRQAGVGR
jgi:hypothetical protein